MTTVSNKQKWFNTIRLTNDDDIYVGIDTHKQSFHVALWLNDAPAIDFVMPPDAVKLIDTLGKIRIALRLVVYEAGPSLRYVSETGLAFPPSLILLRLRYAGQALRRTGRYEGMMLRINFGFKKKEHN